MSVSNKSKKTAFNQRSFRLLILRISFPTPTNLPQAGCAEAEWPELWVLVLPAGDH